MEWEVVGGEMGWMVLREGIDFEGGVSEIAARVARQWKEWSSFDACGSDDPSVSVPFCSVDLDMAETIDVKVNGQDPTVDLRGPWKRRPMYPCVFQQ